MRRGKACVLPSTKAVGLDWLIDLFTKAPIAPNQSTKAEPQCSLTLQHAAGKALGHRRHRCDEQVVINQAQQQRPCSALLGDGTARHDSRAVVHLHIP